MPSVSSTGQPRGLPVSVYGNGEDGALHVVGLQEDAFLVHYTTGLIDINQTYTPLAPAFFSSTLTINGTISRKGTTGNNGSGATAGGVSADMNQGFFPIPRRGAAGGNGGTAAGTDGNAVTIPISTMGGNGTNSGDGGAGSGGAGGVGTGPDSDNEIYHPMDLPQIMRMDATITWLNKAVGGWAGAGGGGGGGDGSGSGGGGGGGGGGGAIMCICAKRVVNNGTITAAGGAGGNGANVAAGNRGGGGGGEGGSGGYILIITDNYSGTNPTAAGGAGGNGGTKNGTGVNGSAGGGGGAGKVIIYNRITDVLTTI